MNSQERIAKQRKSAWDCFYIATRFGDINGLAATLPLSDERIHHDRIMLAHDLYKQALIGKDHSFLLKPFMGSRNDIFKGLFLNCLLAASEIDYLGYPYAIMKVHSSAGRDETVGGFAVSMFKSLKEMDGGTRPLKASEMYALIKMLNLVIYNCPTDEGVRMQLRSVLSAFITYRNDTELSLEIRASLQTAAGSAPTYHPIFEWFAVSGLPSPITFDPSTLLDNMIRSSEVIDKKFCHEVHGAIGSLVDKKSLMHLSPDSDSVQQYERAARDVMEGVKSVGDMVSLFKRTAEVLNVGEDSKEVQISLMPLREEKYRRESIFAEFYMSHSSKIVLDKKSEGRDSRLTRYQNMAFEVYRDTGNVSRLANGNGKFDGYADLSSAEQQIISFIKLLDIGLNPVSVFSSLFLPISPLVRGLFLLGDGALDMQPYSYGVAARKFLSQQRSTSYWLDIPPLQDYESHAKPKNGRKRSGRGNDKTDEGTDVDGEDLPVAIAEEKVVESDYEDNEENGDLM